MDQIILSQGVHRTAQQGLCVMEAVAFFAQEAHSDAPTCACPVVSGFARSLNDVLDDAHRQLLMPLIPALARSRISREVERTRMYLAADFAVRRWAPSALDAQHLPQQAARLRALAPITDRPTAVAGKQAAARAYAIVAATGARVATEAATAVATAVGVGTARAYADAATAVDATDTLAYAAASTVFAARATAARAAAIGAAATAAATAARQDWLAAQGIECLEALLAIRA